MTFPKEVILSLTNAYLVTSSRIPDLFNKIKDGQAPERLTQQLLRDWGFSSTNDRAFIPLLKELKFLTPDGKPTQSYLDYRDHSRSKAILGQAMKEAYGDLFLITTNPTESDRPAIKGKFKSFHNVSDNVANLMTKTFYSLLPLADLSSQAEQKEIPDVEEETEPQTQKDSPRNIHGAGISGLHYNIQIHLPPTKDIEVYNAIFKALRAHLVDE